MVDRGPEYIVTGGPVDRGGLTGQHGLVDAGEACGDHPIGGDLFSRQDDHDVSHRQLLDRDQHLGPVAYHSGLFGADLEQFGDRIRGLTLRPRLEEPSEEDQRDDDGGGFEKQGAVPADRNNRETPR